MEHTRVGSSGSICPTAKGVATTDARGVPPVRNDMSPITSPAVRSCESSVYVPSAFILRTTALPLRMRKMHSGAMPWVTKVSPGGMTCGSDACRKRLTSKSFM